MQIQNVLLVEKVHSYVLARKKKKSFTQEGLAILHTSYERHNKTLKQVKNILKKNNITFESISAHECDSCTADKKDMVITVGGDGTFIYGSHSISDATPILGVRSDNKGSLGRFCSADADNFEEKLHALMNDTAEVIEATRIEITINDSTKTVPALNEVLVTSNDNVVTARYDITVDAKTARHLDSGLLISTGSGSTAWIYTASQITPEDVARVAKVLGNKISIKEARTLSHTLNRETIFGLEEKKLRFFSRDLINSKISSAQLRSGYAKQLKVTSRMYDGKLIVDSKYSFDFPYGALAHIRVASQPLRIID